MSRPMTGSLAWELKQEAADARRSERRYFIYRLHDAEGVVLYVGRSCDVAARLRSHHSDATHQFDQVKARKALWLFDCRTVSMFGPFTWNEAVAQERREIGRLQPAGNIALRSAA